ncbi:MAG: inositol monophosphatase family protein [Candidatus Aquicultorales bacterium]
MKNELREFAGNLAVEAGKLIKRIEGEGVEVRMKGAVDLVTSADIRSEEFITRQIRNVYPDHEILAEEAGGENPGGEPLWIIDPLDGTTNFAHGFPVYAVSIGVEIDGAVVAGAVYDPTADELFTAATGEGAVRNGEPIRVSLVSQLDKSLLATGFPYFFREEADRVLDLFKAYSLQAQGIRRAGAAAIDLCWLACGRLDGFWELGLKPWDTAAGGLIVREAGGVLTRLDGTPFDIRVPQVLGTNGLIHDEMLEIAGEKGY